MLSEIGVGIQKIYGKTKGRCRFEKKIVCKKNRCDFNVSALVMVRTFGVGISTRRLVTGKNCSKWWCRTKNTVVGDVSGTCYTAMLLVDGCGSSRSDVSVVVIVSVVVFEDYLSLLLRLTFEAVSYERCGLSCRLLKSEK